MQGTYSSSMCDVVFVSTFLGLEVLAEVLAANVSGRSPEQRVVRFLVDGRGRAQEKITGYHGGTLQSSSSSEGRLLFLLEQPPTM